MDAKPTKIKNRTSCIFQQSWTMWVQNIKEETIRWTKTKKEGIQYTKKPSFFKKK